MLTAPARPLPYTRARGGGLAGVLAALVWRWRRRDSGTVRAWLELGFRSRSVQLGRFEASIVVWDYAGMVKNQVFWFGLRPLVGRFGVPKKLPKDVRGHSRRGEFSVISAFSSPSATLSGRSARDLPL